MEQAMQPQENNEKEEILYSTEGLFSKLNKWQAIICFFIFPALCIFVIYFGFFFGHDSKLSGSEKIFIAMFSSMVLCFVSYYGFGKCILLSTNKLTLTNKGIIYKTGKKYTIYHGMILVKLQNPKVVRLIDTQIKQVVHYV